MGVGMNVIATVTQYHLRLMN